MRQSIAPAAALVSLRQLMTGGRRAARPRDRERETPMPAVTRRTLLQLSALGAVSYAVPGVAGASQADTYRPLYHCSVPEQWMNDPQRPIYLNGKYQYYYLYNADYTSGGGGTAWRLADTEDCVTFQHSAVAIPKFTTPNGDVWSGSAVVDTGDTAGFGAGAVVALATQPDAQADGAQAQFLWYSTDGGRTFSSYGDRPVLPNPGIADFRDPKVIWEAGRWVALVSEGSAISFYTSANLRDWTYASGFARDGLGLLECPDLFHIQAADGTATWVLGVSANGKPAGLPSTYAYWTGDFDGTEFRPHAADPQWLDHGFDWYAGVTWEKYDGGQLDPTTRYALAWLNNWDYAHNTPTLAADGFNGTNSIVREISLRRWASGELGLISRPVAALDQHVTRTTSLGDIAVDGIVDLSFQGVAYEISAEISWDQIQGAGMQLRKAGDRYVDTGVSDGYAYVNRGATGNPDTSGRWLESRSPFDMAAGQARLRVLVDRTSVELFVDDGRHTHSQLVFPEPGDAGIALFTRGGSAVFGNVTIREFGQIT